MVLVVCQVQMAVSGASWSSRCCFRWSINCSNSRKLAVRHRFNSSSRGTDFQSVKEGIVKVGKNLHTRRLGYN
jgi:hypothetical protein